MPEPDPNGIDLGGDSPIAFPFKSIGRPRAVMTNIGCNGPNASSINWREMAGFAIGAAMASRCSGGQTLGSVAKSAGSGPQGRCRVDGSETSITA